MDGSELVHVRRAARRSQYPSGILGKRNPHPTDGPSTAARPVPNSGYCNHRRRKLRQAESRDLAQAPGRPRPIATLRDRPQHDDNQEENHHTHLQHVRRTAAGCTRPEAGRERKPRPRAPAARFSGGHPHPPVAIADSVDATPSSQCSPEPESPASRGGGAVGWVCTGLPRVYRGSAVNLPKSAAGLPWDCRGPVTLQDRAEGLSRLSPVPAVPC